MNKSYSIIQGNRRLIHVRQKLFVFYVNCLNDTAFCKFALFNLSLNKKLNNAIISISESDINQAVLMAIIALDC